MAERDTRELVHQLLEHTRLVPSRLRADILARGSEAVEPLLALLGDESLARDEAPGGGYAPVHAAELLSELRAPEALGPLVRRLLLTRPGEVLHDALLYALEDLGPAVAPLALEALAEARTLDARLGQLSVLAHSGARDERIFEALLELLREDPGQGALALARYGEPRALEPLMHAFDACPLDEDVEDLFANQALIELESAIVKLGGTLDAARREKLERARSSRRWLGGMLWRMLDSMSPLPEPPGRDDPCWCGSGLRYEECHLGRDSR
ncbi:SEC-C domain-containing protein [Archangium violaceum]|uniref:SEC-C domain-containing protein n=1 Tax=Archangium violaceum TaxID=83451 RepID=UPI00194ED55D|nr:SEC-C domain-containing protein [Archangium violaceum]QRN98097.1 SEC-C domain-containing protein [Archangium violaceum]